MANVHELKMLKSISERKMTDKMKDNIIDVELAIQRELAYRRKVIKLQRQNGDPMQDFLPLQAKVQFTNSSSNSIQIEKSDPWQSPKQASSLPPQPLQLVVVGGNGDPAQDFFPLQAKLQSSGLSSTSIETAKSDPYESLITASSLPPQQPQHNNSIQIYNSQSGGNNLFCKICQVPCSGSSNYKQHLKGHKHKARVKELQLGLNNDGAEGANNRIWCPLCNIWCINRDTYGQHLNGQKHQKAEFAKKNGEHQNTHKYCGLCEIWCTDGTTFKMHLQGKNHVFKLQTMECRRRGREEDGMAEHGP